MFVAGRRVAPHEQLEIGGMRELRRAAEAAVLRIEALLQRADRFRDDLAGKCVVGRRGVLAHPLERDGDRFVLARDVGLVLAVVALDPLEELRKRRHPVARGLREIGADEERHVLARRQERGERPAAAALVEHLVRGLVDLVEVGPLLAVDLDVDEERVHDRGDVGVLERLVGHHVAPVAGGVADREEDRLVLGAGAGNRLLAPGVPVDRVVGVLAEVGARFLREAVRHPPIILAPRGSRARRLRSRSWCRAR